MMNTTLSAIFIDITSHWVSLVGALVALTVTCAVGVAVLLYMAFHERRRQNHARYVAHAADEHFASAKVSNTDLAIWP